MSKMSTPRGTDAILEHSSSFQKSEDSMLKKYKPSIEYDFNFQLPNPEVY